MIRFRTFLEEQTKEVKQSDLNSLEKVLDNLFKKIGIDIEFTKHFLDRVNDRRNKVQITVGELNKIFLNTFHRYADKLKSFRNKFEAVLNDLQTNINIPFVLNWNKRNNMMELVSKTVMRKKDFKTKDIKLKV